MLRTLLVAVTALALVVAATPAAARPPGTGSGRDCTGGRHWDAVQARCVCRSGSVWNEARQQCMRPAPAPPACTGGRVWNAAAGRCICPPDRRYWDGKSGRCTSTPIPPQQIPPGGRRQPQPPR
ncbi:MAG: hypothetical protein HXX10_03300 [Rhodoplanes sp.]|uniref:hypothetical protein n=1 Tax=Rhodoplanes sp. TaxID=1968906 RepID=UPI0018304BD7|nr:hypothetical protein [Rhodoplanes sp.]NVO13042.1 hypothetical protein [Rhodoplanes sp.]